MSSHRLLKFLAFFFALALVVAACGNDDDDEPAAPAPEPAATEAPAPEPAATEAPAPEPAPEPEEMEPFRVAFFYPGTNDDISWSNAWWDGAQAAAANVPNLELEFVELLNEPDAYVQQGSAFADQGYDFLLFAHGAMVDPAIQVATNFPDTQICMAPHHPAPDAPPIPDNMCWVEVDQHNANFLTGVIAALATETGTIGSLNGFEFPALTRQPEAFHLGARCVNPDIGFEQEYINTWVDTAVAKAAAQSLIASGADVILSATDQAVLGIIDAAQEADTQVWVVPSYYDSFDIAPDVVLTSAVHGLADAGQAMIERAYAGEIGPGSYHQFDVTNTAGIIAAPLYDNAGVLTDEDWAIFEDIDAKVRTGEITIPDETAGDPTIGAAGSAADIDVTALGCTPR